MTNPGSIGRIEVLQLQWGSPHSKTMHSTQASTELRIHSKTRCLLSKLKRMGYEEAVRLMNPDTSYLRSYKSSYGILTHRDYVVCDSVISRVYYVEGLGHNLFSVGQFCDSDLEVAFRKHSCYFVISDGVEYIKFLWF
ncbi:hypothetical protein Tco_1523129 [Tanacetum coccineum]